MNRMLQQRRGSLVARFAVFLALALALALSVTVDAFQGPCIQQRAPAAHCQPRGTINHVARPHQTRQSFSKLAASSSDNEDPENESLTSLRKRFKAYVKSSLSIPVSPLSSDYENDHEHHSTSLTQGLLQKEESYRKRLKHYIKAPYRYVKHYFAGERQEEIDGLGDIIVSDETPDEDGNDAVVTTTEATGKDSSLTSLASLRHLDQQLDHGHHSSPQGTLDAAGSSSVATLTKEKENESPSLGIKGDRWAVAAPGVDLSGNWTIITTNSFKKTYDRYLELLGQPLLVRSVALSIVGLTTEETKQSEGGRKLWIRGKNARGVWERTLTASGADSETHTAVNDFTPVLTPIETIDAEKVESEAWWEKNGTVHRSWIRGVTKYGGGNFEAIRYLEQDGNVFVCETTFHPNDAQREKPQVTWSFLKDGKTIN